MGAILVLFVLVVGILYFRLHALPERFAHQKVQFEIVCVLALISLFTHMHIFWIAGLLLALVDLPDFGTPLNRIAGSAEKMAGLKPGESLTEMSYDEHASATHDEKTTDVPSQGSAAAKPGGDAPAIAPKPGVAAGPKKELSHA